MEIFWTLLNGFIGFIALDSAGLIGGYVKYTVQPLPTGPGLTAKK